MVGAALYHDVMVAVDNSECSNHAVELSVELARAMGAIVTGSHVYAAQLHDTRFRQLEPGLPERYQREDVLQRQRDIHDDLIGRGLGVIADSYLQRFEERCCSAGVTARRRTREGRNYLELIREVRENGYDLVVIGAHGLGRVERSALGSVCERVARMVERDLLVVREGRSPASAPILVAMDGSAHSFAALSATLELARLFRSRVSAVAAYDPFFHTAAFRSIAGVLTDEAAKLFRFQEQEKLHDEIIDSGLETVYRSHLVKAQEIAAKRDIPLEIEVLEGKPFDAIASHVERLRPSLLVVGRIGIHHADGVTLGSTAENLLRAANCNVLVVSRVADDGVDAVEATDEPKGALPLRWSAEAEQRLQRVPPFVRGMVRKRVEQLAHSQGVAEITAELFDQARRH